MQELRQDCGLAELRRILYTSLEVGVNNQSDPSSSKGSELPIATESLRAQSSMKLNQSKGSQTEML